MFTDPLRELQALALRVGPRYDPRQCGACDVCGLGPDDIPVVIGVAWATCSACETRWAIGEHVFAGPAWRGEQSEDELHETMTRLAGYVDQPANYNHAHERTRIMSRQSLIPSPAVLRIDPSNFLPLGSSERLFEGVDAEARGYLGARLLEFAAAHGPIIAGGPGRLSNLDRMAQLFWHGHRAEVCDSLGRTVDHTLSKECRGPNPVAAIREALAAMVAAGDVVRTLQARQRENAEALEHFAAIAALAAR